jgi:hypothetical protein
MDARTEAGQGRAVSCSWEPAKAPCPALCARPQGCPPGAGDPDSHSVGGRRRREGWRRGWAATQGDAASGFRSGGEADTRGAEERPREEAFVRIWGWFSAKGTMIISYPCFVLKRAKSKSSMRNSNRMLILGNVHTFQWYFTGRSSFSGILQGGRSFSGTGPIFPSTRYFPTNIKGLFGSVPL